MSPSPTHLQGTVHLLGCALQAPLDSVHAVVLCQKPVQLIAQLGLPEADVRQPLAQVPGGPFLHLTCQLVLILHNPQGVAGQSAGPKPRGLCAPELQLVGAVPVAWGVATEECGAERGQDGGGTPGALAFFWACLGGGDLVEDAGFPRIQVAVPRQMKGLVALLYHRGLPTRGRPLQATVFLGSTVTGCLSGSKKFHLSPSAPRGQNSAQGARASQELEATGPL